MNMPDNPHGAAHGMVPGQRPLMAIVDPNTLAAVGLKQLLQNVMPIITVDT
jgi:hypothetical protein